MVLTINSSNRKSLNKIDDMIDDARLLVRDLNLMQTKLHVKATRSIIKKNEELWESIVNACQDKK